jgi:hypothetical protein
MKSSYDGSHWGLSDWYPEIEKGIKEALINGDDFTTGWYSSKKEIASAKITMKNRWLEVEVSVSDDFDINGYASLEMDFRRSPTPHSIRWNIDSVRKMIDEAWNQAEKDQENNYTFAMYSIHNKKGNWVETYLVNVFGETEQPPGDNYHQWGWQEETTKLPPNVKEHLQKLMEQGKDTINFKGWIAKKVLGPPIDILNEQSPSYFDKYISGDR